MPHQYAASDSTTGLQVQVTGEFPDDPDDRVRIARTTNLFTRLMSTILSTSNDTERRERFRAIETQLEVAEALIRGDFNEVQRLVRETMRQMGITDEQLAEVERQLRQQLETMGAEGLEGLFGFGVTEPEAEPQEPLAQPREDWLPDEPVDPQSTDPEATTDETVAEGIEVDAEPESTHPETANPEVVFEMPAAHSEDHAADGAAGGAAGEAAAEDTDDAGSADDEQPEQQA